MDSAEAPGGLEIDSAMYLASPVEVLSMFGNSGGIDLSAPFAGEFAMPSLQEGSEIYQNMGNRRNGGEGTVVNAS